MRTSDFYAAQYIGRRANQQDAVGYAAVSVRHSLYVLADGMGGHHGGRVAGEAAVAAFLDYFTSNPQAADMPETALRAALAAANRRLAALAAQQPDLSGMGTTLLAVLLDEYDGGFAFVSVGDSPLYRTEGSLLCRLNANHAFAEVLKRLVAAGEMSAEEADTHPARHAVTSAVGGGEIPKVDTGTGVLAAGGRLLLASDGIHTLTESEITAVLAAGMPVRQTVEALMARVRGKDDPYQDNTSAILLSHCPQSTTVAPTVQTQMQPPATLVQRTDGGAARRRVWTAAAFAVLAAVLWWCLAEDGTPEQRSVPAAPAAQTASQIRQEND